MAVSMIFTICLTCIAIGREVAYGIFVSLNLSGLVTSYIICIACNHHPQPNPFRAIHLLIIPNHMHPPQTPPRRILPAISLQFGQQNRYCDQHHRLVFPGRVLCIPVRATSAQSGGEGYELELCDLDGCTCFLYGVL